MPGGGKKAVFPTLALHDHEQVRVVAREQGRAKRFHQSRGKSSEGGKDSPDKETPKPKNKNPPKTEDPSKTKWKSFRNSFEKETNINPIEHCEDSACGPKWDYFKPPLMMRETRMKECLKIETVVPEIDVNEEISAISIESIFEDEGDDIQLIDAVSENTNLDSQESGITSLSIDLNTDHSNFDNDRDPYINENKNMQVTQEEEDDDLHFFKSLLPFMKKRLEPNERRIRLWRRNRRKKIMRAAPQSKALLMKQESDEELSPVSIFSYFSQSRDEN